MKLRVIIYFSLLLVAVSGCSDFLDIQPKDKQSEEQLFATRGGFYTAVNGIYNKLASSTLYGKNLTYEMIDILAFRYTPLSVNEYYTALVKLDYADETVEANLSSIWAAAYTVILNCNVLLKNLELSTGVLSEQEKNLLTGEALALRAFLHFDMLRLFGPVYVKDPSAEAIPYNESDKVSALPILSADTVMGRVLRDLNAAERLLEGNDPVIEQGAMASLEKDQEVYLRYRQLRFNYYAVLALKARAYLYAGDKVNALITARRLLMDENVAKHFPAVDPNKLLANQRTPDRVFSTEVLMGFYDKNRADIYTYYFDDETAGNHFLQPKANFVLSSLFGNENQDYRFQTHWKSATSVGVQGEIFIKYKKIDKPKDENNSDKPNEDLEYFHAVLMPLIRLSEVYYIAAECETELQDGYDWLNQIRAKRGLPALTVNSEGDLRTRLNNEYAREFWGEGQTFFLHKRLNTEYLWIDEAGYNYNGANYLKFTIPLPKGEIENR